MIISPYPKPTKCYGDTVIRRYGVLKKLTQFLKRLTFPSENLFFHRKVVSLHPVIASRVAHVPTNRPKAVRSAKNHF